MPRRRFKPGRFLTETTEEIGCGAVSLDVTMARRHGWTQKAIERAWRKLSAISRFETGIAHRRGKVAGCPCVTCDPDGEVPPRRRP